MNSIRKPAFSSPDLQKAIDKAQLILVTADAVQNQVSNDIRALEGYLESIELRIPFEFSLGKSLFNATGNASSTVREEALSWKPDSKGRFRLIYEERTWEGYVDVDNEFGGPFSCDESTIQVGSKPLIETKFDIRKRMFKHLPSFVAALANEITVDGAEIPF